MDFTNCQKVFGKAYSGANGKKIAIEYNGKQYMLKFPPSGANKPTALSYTNSCLSEHIGSSVFNLLGIEAQNTILGTFTVNEKKKIVCACEDFTADGSIFYDFCSIKNTIIDSEHEGNGTELDDLIETIEKQQFVDPKTLLERFWDVFVVDALLGNFDRHNGNWGFLYHPINKSTKIAPVFDCGSCLLPQADEKIMHLLLNNEVELDARIYRFPTSAIHLNGKKINYYDFLCSGLSEDCGMALAKMIGRIDIAKINSVIEKTDYLTDLQIEFYKHYVFSRYKKILLSAFNKM